MKRLFFLLSGIIISNLIFGQSENFTKAFDSFKLNYNAEKYEEIFNDFSAAMKKALPLENTRQFLSGLKSQVGKIQNQVFVRGQQSGAIYKTQFEKATLSVYMALDSQNRIAGLQIKPYKDPAQDTSKAINGLSRYPREIADIIFSKTKDFPDQTQLSVAIVRDGQTGYYGIIKTNDTIKPVENEKKIFEIGSITKVFTSTVLASLVEEKKIQLTAKINAYYPFTFHGGINITFKDLANHTSGLPRLPENLDLSNVNNPYENYGKKEIEEYLKNLMTLKSEPGSAYAYSNLGAGLLGYTLGLSQKMDFQKLLRKVVFDKYKMKNSFTSSQNLGDKLVRGLNPGGKVIDNWDFDVLFAAGGILSTTEDLVKFAKAQFNPANKELALTRKPTFKINDNMQVGLGWHLLKTKGGKDIVWHNGGTGGYSSSISIDADDKTAVIILSNLSTFHPEMGKIDELCFELVDKTGN